MMWVMTVRQVDDAEDMEVVSVLLDPPVPDGFEVCNTERMPGVAHLVNNLQVLSTVFILQCLYFTKFQY